MLVDYVYAMGGPGGGGESTGGIAGLLLPFAMVFAIIYFLMIRPQQKKQADHRRLLEALSPGDQVITSGGILGTVAKIRDDKVFLEVAENVKIRVNKSNVASITGKGGNSKDEQGEDDENGKE